MLNEIVAVVVSQFSREGKEADKNGLANVYLTAVAGKIPNQALIVAGTVAVKAGLEIGKTLLVMVNEGTVSAEYGRQFNHTVLGEVKPSEILGLRKELGAPLVIDTKGAAVTPENNGNPLNTSALPNQAGATPELGNNEKPATEQPAGENKAANANKAAANKA